MNLSELRDLIRAETDIQGLREYQNLIDNLVVQELRRLTGKSKYTELSEDYVFTSSVVNTFSFSLPSDFQLFGSLIYQPNTAVNNFCGNRPLAKGFQDGYLTRINGFPQFYARKANTLFFYPYNSMSIGDSMLLSYYKRPDLMLDTDEFPVESLIPAVSTFVMSRMMMMKDTSKGIALRQTAELLWKDTRSEHAGDQ